MAIGYWPIGLLAYWPIGLLAYWPIGLLPAWAVHIEDDPQQVHPLLVLSKFAEAGIEAAGLWRPVAGCGRIILPL